MREHQMHTLRLRPSPAIFSPYQLKIVSLHGKTGRGACAPAEAPGAEYDLQNGRA